MKRFPFLLALGVAASAIGLGCSTDHALEPPTAVTSAKPDESLLGGLTSTVVKVVNWTVPISNDVSWSFTAGPEGARSSNAATGLSILVPPGALSRNVTITVTAVKGNVVNYKFQPEGLQFAYPVTLTQNLSLTTTLLDALSGTRLKGAYYAAPKLVYDPSSNTAKVDEYEPSFTNLLQGTVSWEIRHFSGYVVASCEGGGLLGLGL